MNEFTQILFFIFVFLFILLIIGITNYFTYVNTKKSIEKVVKTTIDKREYNLKESIELMDYIDSMIDEEIIYRLKKTIITKDKYDLLSIDKDAESVAKAVYEAFKKDFLATNNYVFETRLYQEYIVKKSIVKLLMYTSDYNKNFS